MLKRFVNKILSFWGLTIMSQTDIKFMIKHEINHHEYRRLFPKKDHNLVNIVKEQKVAMKKYKVIWEIDLWAENPEDAAKKALAVQRDPDSLATVFTVGNETIDLDEVEWDND